MKKLSVSLLVVAIAFLVAPNYCGAQIITTIAGGAAPTNIQATSMGMEIFGTVADKLGNLYVSDASNSVVRKVNLSTGIATIIAGVGNNGYHGDGGPAINAGLVYPQTLGIDTAGNLYIGDGPRIRKVNISTGIITTVVGNGIYGYGGDGNVATSAEISGEPGIGFDKKNNMYIADFGNNRVREVNAKTGIITTIAGTGTGAYNGDNIAATSAELYYPAGVCVDDTGNVFIAEQSNSRVRKVSWKTGIITTIAGTGGFGYNGDNIPATTAALYCPLSVEVDKAGNLYIADWGNSRVREVNAVTGIITTIAGDGLLVHNGDGGPAIAAGLDYCYSAVLDAQNNIYIVEGFNPVRGYNSWIRKVDANTQNISTVVGNGSSNYTGDGISATSAQLCSPSSVKIDAAGNIYVADYGNNRIRKIDGSGTISTYAGDGQAGFLDNMLADSGELFSPNDMAFDKSGNMFIADQFNNRIRKVDLNDSIRYIAGDGSGAPYQGYFYGDGGLALFAEFYFPSGVAIDDSGNIFIADTYNDRIREINWKTDTITTIAGNGGGGYNGDGRLAIRAELYYPTQVAVDDSDNLYIADEGNSRIRKVTHATGIITTYAGTGNVGYTGDGSAAISAELNYPEGVALDKYNMLYISDAGNNSIRTVNPSTGIINTIAGNGTGGFSGDGGLATSAELNVPENVAFDAAGNMYIADNGNNRIRKVTGIVGLGVDKVTAVNAQIKVYPNPSNGNFQLGITNEELGMSNTVEVYNMLGEKVYSCYQITKSSNYQIDLSAQPNGVYLYKVMAESGEILGQGKLVIQK
jgi:sugar lactone lactonase YvrE